MEDVDFSARLKKIKRKFSRKASYDVDFKAPSFKVKSLCLDGIPVEAISNQCSNEAVDKALSSVGSLQGKNKQDILLKISIKYGIQIICRKSKAEMFNYKIHQVGYCNVDKRYPQIFVFIAAMQKVDLTCHVFLCEDIQKSRAICLTMANIFKNSFENWQKSKEMSNSTQVKVNRLDIRRQSADVVAMPPPKHLLDTRRASDFVTAGGFKRTNVRRGSTDTDSKTSSDEEGFDDDANQAFEDILSKSADNGKCSLLRRDSTDWDAIAQDEEIQRKMQGDLILWE